MKTTYDIKMALDPDLFVRSVPVWQAERRMRDGRKYPDNLVYLTPSWLDDPQEEEQKDTVSGLVKLALAGAAAVLCLGLIAMIAL